MLALASSLSLKRLRLLVRLGCSAEERSIPQYVSVEVEVRFQSPPQGCQSDSLQETICYAQLSEKIKRVCDQREYALIEKLGWAIYQAVRELLPQSALLLVRTHKERPPVDHLEGGAVFTLGDWMSS